MKRILILLMAAILLMTAGCGAQQPESAEVPTPPTTVPATEAPTEPPTEAPTEAPTEPVPECVNAVVQVDDAPAILELLNRGDAVDVVGEYDEDHYVIKREIGYGLVEKQLLRMSSEPAYEVWTGYATRKAALYTNYQLMGEVQANLNMNTQIDVLDELEYCYVVKVGEESGFIAKAQVSKDYIRYSGGGGGGGGADGGDISLSFGGIARLSVIEQSGEVTGTAEVLADGTQVILGYFDREELAPVVAEEGFAPAWEGYYTLYLDGLYGYLPQNLALAEGEESYIQWDGFAAHQAKVYDNRLLQGEGVQISVNTSVTILWDGGDVYVVSIDGDIGYMAKTLVGQKRFSTNRGGGGNSGGDWTPPAM